MTDLRDAARDESREVVLNHFKRDGAMVYEYLAVKIIESLVAEVRILREGLCDIAKTAIENKDPTFGDMAANTLHDANNPAVSGRETSDQFITAEQLAAGIFGTEHWEDHPAYLRARAWVMETFYPERSTDDSSPTPPLDSVVVDYSECADEKGQATDG